MNEPAPHRKPAAFRLDDPHVRVAEADAGTVRRGHATVRVIPEPDSATLPATVDIAPPPRRGFRWGRLLWTSLGGLVILGMGLSAVRLVEDLFARNDVIGVIGLGLALVAAIALVAIAVRETVALARLATIEKLHRKSAEVIASDDRAGGRALVADLMRFTRHNPNLAHARALLRAHENDIIDGADHVRLAERELMTPLDAQARRLIFRAAQSVSVVTAVSPRAAIDMLFVLAAAVRLVRQLAQLYGGRPGALGLIKLMRLTIAHLAITGGIAASDSLVQQMLGHGVAAKLSTRLGEGILNGLLTARLGIAAVDVVRPLPFVALPPPALSDLVKDLLRKREADTSKAKAAIEDGSASA
jgi:putative membrane protein